MRSGKKAVNCTLCAKRKVRCDKEQPCGHCKRRKGDVCVYPASDAREERDAAADAERIGKLESYIRSLGRDPLELYSVDERPVAPSTGLSVRRSEQPAFVAGPGGLPTPSNVANGEAQRACLSVVNKTAALTRRDEDHTYIEAPMWYSWSGAAQSTDEAQHQPDKQATSIEDPSERFAQCLPTLLERRVTPSPNYSPPLMVVGEEASSLWETYLKHIHPLTKIFFDWETQPLMKYAFEDAGRLSPAEKCLVAAIYFIATLSLPTPKPATDAQKDRTRLLELRQIVAEHALTDADFITTTDKRVLQGFMLYTLAMRNRARPTAIYSLMGIAVRIAERMGVHRDGSRLGLSIVRSEERRRIWWLLQNMEISIGQLTGSISMTIYADWDAKLPANVEDSDLHAGMTEPPAERCGLASMSHCLWRYCILHYQREDRDSNGRFEGLLWLLSSQVPLEEKDARIMRVNQRLSQRFITHCDPLDPLHLYIQVGIRAFHLAALRTARQPALINAKISEMSVKERDEFLDICIRATEYYVLCMEHKGLEGYQWHTAQYFQWTAFVYVVLEAHHRYNQSRVDSIWTLIRKVYAVHPELAMATHRTETAAVGELTLAAWQKRSTYRREQLKNAPPSLTDTDREQLSWIQELCSRFNLPQPTNPAMEGPVIDEAIFDAVQFLPADFDFDAIDWSFWQDPNLEMTTFDFLE